jgi:predicted phage terminase large subunit-like protein
MSKFSPTLFNHFASRNLVLFVEKVFTELYPEGTFLPNWHIEALVNLLEQIIAGRCRRLIVNLPPQFLKSMICSVALPAFILGIDPTKKILCVSYAQPLSEHLHSEFRRIVGSSWYQKMFRPKVLKDTASEYETSQGGSRMATSVYGTMTGLGADLIILDDPLNAGEAHLKSARDGVNNWYTASLVSRLSNKNTGAILLVAQRLHPEDLTGVLSQHGGWDQLCLPAIAPCDREIALMAGRKHCWKKDEALHPELLGLAALQDLKNDLGASIFSAQYLQEPLQPSGNLLKIDWLASYDTAPVRAAGDLVVQSWDTAIKANARSDYSAGLTLLVRQNQIYLLEILRSRLEYPDLVRQVQSQAEKHRPDVLLIEDVNSGSSLFQTLKQLGHSGVIGCKPDKDKQTRMIRHTHQLEADPLLVPKHARWLEDFRAEYLAFPYSRHDDQFDALSQFYGWFDERRRRTPFSFEYDHGGTEPTWGARLGAPSVAEIWGIFRT